MARLIRENRHYEITEEDMKVAFPMLTAKIKYVEATCFNKKHDLIIKIETEAEGLDE